VSRMVLGGGGLETLIKEVIIRNSKSNIWEVGMALVQCPECGNEISDTATSCPQCGYEIPVAGDAIKSVGQIVGGIGSMIMAIVAIVFLLGIVGCSVAVFFG
jgi:hypothetical protein